MVSGLLGCCGDKEQSNMADLVSITVSNDVTLGLEGLPIEDLNKQT